MPWITPCTASFILCCRLGSFSILFLRTLFEKVIINLVLLWSLISQFPYHGNYMYVFTSTYGISSMVASSFSFFFFCWLIWLSQNSTQETILLLLILYISSQIYCLHSMFKSFPGRKKGIQQTCCFMIEEVKFPVFKNFDNKYLKYINFMLWWRVISTHGASPNRGCRALHNKILIKIFIIQILSWILS